ncbi:uncharacterized protein K02A2.6 [Trichonephila clavata]|uniref:Uncharacterized protein K02A2.6 n=1 Tax=Trichonephila clavata TaxID=2740835 RepID=A0A8X6G314_TRICU|nr:uncharacterized protein K02A2.6 [Trichonephila clavata]
MKALGRSFVNWKNIDKDIKEAAKNCADCARHYTDPTKAKVHYWEYPSMSWELINRLMQRNGVKHKTSAPFKPSNNGQAERYVVTLKLSLRAMQKYEVRRHVDQIRLVGDQVQENIFSIIHQRFPLVEGRENNPNIQHAENPSRDMNKELGSSSVLEVLSTDVAVPDVPPSSAKVTESTSSREAIA